MKSTALVLVFISSIASAQFVNTKLGETDPATPGTGAAIAVSPRNNKVIVAFAAGKIVHSNDGGSTWMPSQPASLPGLQGAVSATSDMKGNFFLTYAADVASVGNTSIICRHSTDNGKTFSDAIVVAAVPGKDLYNPTAGTHPKKEEILITWTQADKFKSEATDCKSTIMLGVSGNGGKKWSKPLQLNQNDGDCNDGELTLKASIPTVALDGKIFIIWGGQGAMFYDRSYDGEMWISTDLAIAEQVGGRGITIPGFGLVTNSATVAVDNSASRIHGTLFLAYSDLKSGKTDSDIWLMRSVNRGDNWTIAARINQDEKDNYQFFPKISIDPSNGFIYIMYYDRRSYDDNQTDVYIAWSVDGGNQFKEKKVNDKPVVPNLEGTNTATDFISLGVQKGVIATAWTSFAGGKQEVWTSVIKHEDLIK